jgi:mevalonate pyrophosphate decarboxylase
LKKTKDLIKRLTEDQIKQLRQIGEKALFFTEDAGSTKKINSNSVSLTVTSPPFLDVVNYNEETSEKSTCLPQAG